MSEVRISNFIACRHKNANLDIFDCNEEWVQVQTIDEAIKLIVELEKFIKSKVEEGESV